LALKQNMELRNKLEKAQEQSESMCVQKVLELGEQYSQKIKECY